MLISICHRRIPGSGVSRSNLPSTWPSGRTRCVTQNDIDNAVGLLVHEPVAAPCNHVHGYGSPPERAQRARDRRIDGSERMLAPTRIIGVSPGRGSSGAELLDSGIGLSVELEPRAQLRAARVGSRIVRATSSSLTAVRSNARRSKKLRKYTAWRPCTRRSGRPGVSDGTRSARGPVPS